MFLTFFIIKKLDCFSFDDTSLDTKGIVFIDHNISIQYPFVLTISVQCVAIEPTASICLKFKFELKFSTYFTGSFDYFFSTMKITHSFTKSLCPKTIRKSVLLDRFEIFCYLFLDIF